MYGISSFETSTDSSFHKMETYDWRKLDMPLRISIFCNHFYFERENIIQLRILMKT